mmetsp:Transcript_9144/g.29068  ORF Transcript_9144/g.29068 Transcript_9144/m.29068 type:complete len:104 (-) Transcript_9144:46-357(-)
MRAQPTPPPNSDLRCAALSKDAPPAQPERAPDTGERSSTHVLPPSVSQPGEADPPLVPRRDRLSHRGSWGSAPLHRWSSVGSAALGVVAFRGRRKLRSKALQS